MNEKGITLVEVIFSFSIFLLIVSFIPFLMKVIAIEQEESIEVELFFQQVSPEIRSARNLNAIDSKLFIKLSPSTEVIYEQYQNMIRRKVNGLGHEVLLQNIHSVYFKNENHGVTITVTNKTGEIYSRRLSMTSVFMDNDS